MFDGGPGTGEALTWIESLGFTSLRMAENERKTINDNENVDRIRIYFADRGFGFTREDVYFHVAEIVKGTPREGAKIEYTTVETDKGLRAKNVYIDGGVS